MSVHRQPASALVLACAASLGCALSPALAWAQSPMPGPAAWVNPLIGTAHGGNVFPGAVLPFGMVQWSPEVPTEDTRRHAAPGGYTYDAGRIRGFALTHLSGTGCRGASGDVPFLPVADTVTISPSADTTDRVYAGRFAHANERARAGYYQVRFASGINTQLTVTARTGSARFTFPDLRPATLLIRVSDSEVGSSDASVRIHPATRTITGSVTSGNFCGYINAVDRRSYYTLYFVAVFDHAFVRYGTWHDGRLMRDGTAASGGTSYGAKGVPPRGLGSGTYVTFSTGDPPGARGPGDAVAVGPPGTLTVGVRVGISYVSLADAQANLRAENPAGTSFEAVRRRARDAWNRALGRIEVDGGSSARRTTFYTALYHALLHMSLISDVNGAYPGMDGRTHRVVAPQKAQYANFSGWDVYRSQLQLVALLEPARAADMAQSLLNQAVQNDGEWDRWTHESGATHVMEGDVAAPAIADIVAFGGTGFDMRTAYASLARAATMPTTNDRSDRGCRVECVGQRPSLERWLTIHYIPTKSNAWGGAGETLEDATADFALSQLAARLGDDAGQHRFLSRSGYWRNLYNPAATSGAGYIQDRDEDGAWTRLNPASSRGFAEGSAAQYTWMVPFDVRGLFDAMGGDSIAVRRLNAFFHNPDGSWALTGLGGLHAELDNEPSLATPWLYDFAGRPDLAQATVHAIVDTLWGDRPDGIPGNDDLGEMSSWYVWAAMGMYPEIPGRAELLLASPSFAHIVIRRANGVSITIDAPGAGTGRRYVRSLTLDGRPRSRPWLKASFVATGGTLDYVLSAAVDTAWGAARRDAPPSFAAHPAGR